MDSVTVSITDIVAGTLDSATVSVSCFGGNDGSIDLTVNGGTGAMTYAWTGPGGFTSTTEDPSNLIAGVYNVSVTDGVGCIMTLVVTVNEPPLLVLTPAFTNVTCFGGTDGTGSASATGGVGPYTYDWFDNAALTNNIGNGTPLGGLAAGTYYVQVTDANGCQQDGSIIITEPADIVVTVAATDANCGQANGTVAVTGITGGSGIYTSTSWTDATPAAVGDTNAVLAGSYTVVVTDNNGCTGTAVAVVSDILGPVLDAFTTTPVTCAGDCDGTAGVTVSGGTGGYTYAWTPGNPTGQGTPTISDLCAGDYTCVITDAAGCVVSQIITVIEPAPISVTITASTPTSGFGISDGTADAAGAGGNAPYTFEWFAGCPPAALVTTGQTGTSAVGLAAGDYAVVVTDAKGCMDTTCVTIIEPPTILTPLTGVDVTCFGDCDGSVTVAPSGGVPGYTYVWYTSAGAPIGQTGITASNLCPGDYYVEVTDLNSITVQSLDYTVGEPTQVTGTTSVVSDYNGQDISCAGACDGSVDITSSGGIGALTYAWDDPTLATTTIVSNLCPGTYNVIITDSSGCTATYPVTVTEPLPLAVTIAETPESCFELCDGVLAATATDGTAGYSYQWDDPLLTTTATLNNVCSGTYNVVVTDTNGCTANAAVVMVPPVEIILVGDSVGSNCGAADGSATVNVAQGTGPMTILWDAAAGNQTTFTATGLAAGCYTAVVTDGTASACSQSITVCVVDLGAPAVEILTVLDVTCNGVCDGFAQVQVTAGTNSIPPYSYAWFDVAMNPIGQTTASAFNLCAGDYTAQMTDSNGCLASIAVTINEPPVLNASIIAETDVTCYGYTDGDATVLAGGGTSPYTYLWNDGAAQTTAQATNLAPGFYTVTVTDSLGCVTTADTTIAEPLEIQVTEGFVDAFCLTATGSAWVQVTANGVGNFSYSWTGGQATDTAVNLVPGVYNVTVTDADGCFVTTSVTVGDIPPGTSTAININDVSCFGSCDGQATVSNGGTGNAPYTYEWYDAANNMIGQQGDTAINLCPGDYYVVVTDVNLCVTTSNTITIAEPAQLTLAMSMTPTDCKASCNGTATGAVGGGTGAITGVWDDPLLQTTFTANSLCAGLYTVNYTDANGCTISDTVTVTEPPQIFLDSTVVNANCGLDDGSACVSATGGVGGYTYLWPDNSTNNCNTNLFAGSYLVTVADANGCTEQIVVQVDDLLGPVAAITGQTEVTCNGICDGTATVDMVGGAGVTFTVLWDSLANDQITPTATNLCAGTYTVVITDDLGCNASISATITEPTAVATNPGQIDPTCFGYCDGVVYVTTAGGTPGYTWTWRDAALNPIGNQ